MSSIRKTYCRNCTGHCGLEFEVEDNRLVSVRGDTEQPMSQGYYCVKANMSVALGKGEYPRLTECMKGDGQGNFEPTTKEQAMASIASKIRELVDRYGPRSVGIFYGTGAYFNGLSWPLMKSFLGELGSPNLFSTMTIDQSASWVRILRQGTMASGAYDPQEVDTLMLVGKNPVVSHQLTGFFRTGKSLVEKKRNGVEVIVVDPRATETAQRASCHLALKPGEDATLFAGMIRLILANDWHDNKFCERFTDNIDALRAAVEPYELDYVAQRTGLDAELIRSATEKFALAPRSLAVEGTGTTMGPHSNLNVHLLGCLNAICGNFNRAGDPVKNQSVLFPRPFVEVAVPPNRSWEQGVQCLSTSTGQMFGEFPTGALPGEILSSSKDRIRALIVLGGNPLTALGQPDKTMRAFARLDLLVSIDPRMTDTGHMAHYIIPPKLQYERHDLSTVMDGITGFTRPFVQYAEPLVAAPAGVVDEGEFFWDLARRLGLDLVYKKMILGMNYHEIEQGFPVDMTKMPGGEQLARWWCEGTPVEFDSLASQPSGLSVELPDTRVLEAPDNGARMALCPADVTEELAAVRNEISSDGAYPYRLTSRRLLECLNSLYTDSSQTKSRYPTNFAYMHPGDVEKEGWADLQAIRISSPHGEITAQVKSDKSLRPGVVSMAHQWGTALPGDDPGGEKGALTARLVSLDNDIEAINHMPRQTAIPVMLQAVS